MKLKGRIDIARYSSNVEPYKGINIRIRDEASGVEFLNVNMTINDFAEAITGLSNQDMTFDLRDEAVKLIGLVRQHKTESIALPAGVYTLRREKPKDVALIKTLLEPYEVDGWLGDDDDFSNGHRVKKTKGEDNYRCNVAFTRYVKPDEVKASKPYPGCTMDCVGACRRDPNCGE